MPIFGPKCQFWAKFGRFWAKNPIFLGNRVKTFGTLLSGNHRDFQILDPRSMISQKIFHCIRPFFRNNAPVSTPSSYCIGYSVIKDTVSSYFTKYTFCSGLNHESIFMQRAKFLDSFYADDDISVAVWVDN